MPHLGESGFNPRDLKGKKKTRTFGEQVAAGNLLGIHENEFDRPEDFQRALARSESLGASVTRTTGGGGLRGRRGSSRSAQILSPLKTSTTTVPSLVGAKRKRAARLLLGE